MLAQPEDLLVRAPESFASDEGRRAARAFRDAWRCLTPLVPTANMAEAQRLLAELVFERGKHHGSLESLRLEVLPLALAEVRERYRI